MKEIIEQLLKARLDYLINGNDQRSWRDAGDAEVIERKKKLFEKRGVKIVKARMKTAIKDHWLEDDGTAHVNYQSHTAYLCKDGDDMYMEEQIEKRTALLYDQMVVKDTEIPRPSVQPISDDEYCADAEKRELLGRAFTYDRLSAVRYAETFWNKRNSAYKNFEDNCTNFISQCIRAGDAPMRGYPNRGAGWWMQNHSWSYSWTVAHSLRTFLKRSKTGLRAIQAGAAEELTVGDVICYDFNGDGRFDHVAIVTAKDKGNMPLVNAQTHDCRMRYWSYEDSPAYTPSIRYAFFHIADDTTKA
ncbi:amidase domain-containing protein [Bacillus glycinifermentans]|uniref:amidase domain-containing protein n=1 Tax=Bacillus glycinifermentans TaxID=1664069 RepID=UPI002DB645AB|nr:amidase domain-containing protein [Bacillus glycinifermentans]MEC3606239.1 amidase domain-containing protein [Bacillus glycinifermentans]